MRHSRPAGCCSQCTQQGENTTVAMSFMMHGDMGGPHDFRVHLLTNDPQQSDKTMQVLSNWK
jgi:hypothetical protein